MNLYAKGLLEYDQQDVNMLPSPAKRGRNSNKTQRVDVELVSGDNTKYPITYSMFKAKDDAWKVENVIVNGINIGLTYRKQFERLMRKNKNDVDAAIAGWTSEVNE